MNPEGSAGAGCWIVTYNLVLLLPSVIGEHMISARYNTLSGV
jgi:hypothetical protein